MIPPRAIGAFLLNGAAALALLLGTTPAMTPSAEAGSLQTVSFGGVEVQVPAAWPVVDFAVNPVGCLRLDRNVVYLGTPRVSDCPAHLVGGAQTVQVAFTSAAPGPGSAGRNLHGLRWTRSGAIGAPGTVQVAGDASRASVTITAAGTDEVTRAITDSVRQVGQAPAGAAAPMPAMTPAAATSSTATSSIAATSYTTGEGFDTCTAPSVADMQAWLYPSSPYRSVNIYMGGVDRGCSQPNLDSAWVTQVTGQGWTLIPTYVGLQAPCWSGSSAKIDPANAATQGAQAATDAANGMGALGLGAGNPVYYDMEGYSTSNSACVSAVETFVDSWTQRLHALGYVSGFYSSAASGITNMVQKSSDPTYHLPDDIWFAHWNGSDTVYGDSYVPDNLWANHQRIHQYRGGHNETYGGVTLNIDNNALDGATATPAGAFKVPSDVNGDGRSDLCVFTGVNGYATASGKLELHCLSGASTYATRLVDLSTSFGYADTRHQLPIGLDDDGDGKTDACLLTGLNGDATSSGMTEVHCANASGDFAAASLDVPTPWGHLDTHASYPVALDANGDGKTDLCIYTGINGHPTASGMLEVHCLDGASSYSTSLVDAVTPFGYVNTWAALPIGLDVDGDGKTDACLLTGLNGQTTASGRLELRCALAANGFTGTAFSVSTSSGYLDTRYDYPVALDVNGDGLTDLCVLTGLNGGTTGTGKLEVHCLNGATKYASTLIGVSSGYGYLQTAANAFLADAPVDVDTVAPALAPATLPVFDRSSPLTFRFTGTDASSGVGSYDARYRVAAYNRGFGSYVLPASWQGTTATAVALRPIRGATYCFSVRARDHARNVSAWSAERCTAVPLDERSLVASSGWLQASSSTYYAGTISRSASIGRTLTRTGVQTHRIAIVATTCPGCGTVGVYWNGTLLKKISLSSSTARSQQVLGVTIFRGVASGTLVVRSLTTSRGYVDGLALSRV